MSHIPYKKRILTSIWLSNVQIPIFRGISPASKSNGPWTPTAELLNGRAAMLGFVALLATEWAKGAAVF